MNKWLKGSPPRGTYQFWAWSKLDGVYHGTKGLGSDDWYTAGGQRTWTAPEYWMPFEPPPPPSSLNT